MGSRLACYTYEMCEVNWACIRCFKLRKSTYISTARDLAKFFLALLFERTLLPDNLLQQMMTVVQDQPPAEQMYGLGLMADPLPSGTVWGHSGGGYGYRNLPYIQCETGLFIVFMLNSSYGFHVATGAPPVPDRVVRAEAYKHAS